MRAFDLQGKRVLVTGGAGFIGSHLTDRLVDLGAFVTVLDDFSSGRSSNLRRSRKRVRLIRGDITSTSGLNRFSNMDVIFHLAASQLLSSFKSPERDIRVNAVGTLRMIDCARRCDAKLVYASSGSVYGNPQSIPISEDAQPSPISPYGVSKLTGEMYIRFASRTYALPAVCLRYFNVYGPRQSVAAAVGVIPRFVRLALRNEPLTIFGNGKQSRDFTYVSDVVDATLAASQATRLDELALNIGTGVECTILSLARTIISICKSRSKTIFAQEKPGDIDRLCADIGRARKSIDYAPSVDLRQGVRILIDYFTKPRKASYRRPS